MSVRFAEYYATRVPLTEQAVSVGVQGKPLNCMQLGQVFRSRLDPALHARERARATRSDQAARWVGRR
jgi:hypothetical protein